MDDDDDAVVLEEAIPAGRYLNAPAVARRLGITVKGVQWLSYVGRLGAIITPLGRIYTERHVETYLRKKAELWPRKRRGNLRWPRRPARS